MGIKMIVHYKFTRHLNETIKIKQKGKEIFDNKIESKAVDWLWICEMFGGTFWLQQLQEKKNHWCTLVSSKRPLDRESVIYVL